MCLSFDSVSDFLHGENLYVNQKDGHDVSLVASVISKSDLSQAVPDVAELHGMLGNLDAVAKAIIL